MAPTNQAAWLTKADTPLEVGDAPFPTAGHMQDHGVFVQQWPSIFGCDVAGEVYETGEGVDSFKKGDRVIG
jgi:NADPH:quinone reductase-like Zn-dependent oxidoreductase